MVSGANPSSLLKISNRMKKSHTNLVIIFFNLNSLKISYDYGRVSVRFFYKNNSISLCLLTLLTLLTLLRFSNVSPCSRSCIFPKYNFARIALCFYQVKRVRSLSRKDPAALTADPPMQQLLDNADKYNKKVVCCCDKREQRVCM